MTMIMARRSRNQVDTDFSPFKNGLKSVLRIRAPCAEMNVCSAGTAWSIYDQKPSPAQDSIRY